MKRWFFLCLILLFVSTLHATHQRSGEITYTHVSGLTYEFKIVTYTFAPSPADRPDLDIKWGDGTSDVLPRVNGVPGYNPAGIWVNHVGEIVGPNIRKNVYMGRHTFPGASTYTISLEDPNRNAGIINIPNSVDVPFYIQTTLLISPFLGINNSPQLLLPPIDNACVGKKFVHNTGAFDPDGDSLSFKLVSCRGVGGAIIPGYTLPAASNSLSINPVTGDLIWDNPTMQGEFNLAILIEEWRGGIRIGTVTRDLQIIVGSCENNQNPPVLIVPTQVCVVAGDTLIIRVIATDLDGHKITLTGNGQPLLMTSNPAEFPQPADSAGRVSALFKWAPICNHIRKAPYQMFFKAQDNGTPVRLIDVKTLNILVIGPAPKNLTATPLGNRIRLTWNKSTCSNASGYKIYRKIGPSDFVPGNCITGVPTSSGFQFVKTNTSLNDTTYDDLGGDIGLIHGIRYCYLVTAIFPDGSEGYASNQTCTTPKRDVPVITNANVLSTAATTGAIYVAWSKPTELDFLQTPGPFKYIIRRATGQQTNFQAIDSLNSLNDTIFTDYGLNTTSFAYTYKIDLTNNTPGNRFLVGSTQPATTIYLQIAPNDQRLDLSWSVKVPWMNTRYVILRLNPQTLQFDSVGFSTVASYSDKNLTNFTNYCYKIRSVGDYPAGGMVSPIVNFSQEKCAVPSDLTPPCAPYLWVDTHCDQLQNRLSWTNTNNYCPNTNDTKKYFIWYRKTPAEDFKLLDSTLRAIDTVYIHQTKISITGCYAITAIDLRNNRSGFSNEVCVSSDACPQYALPNVFTPNGDSYNDRWIPFPFSGVEKIDLKLFNRWGRMVFETQDPQVNWDGRNMATNQQCPDGVYFYVCDVYEVTLEGPQKRTINGSVHLIR